MASTPFSNLFIWDIGQRWKNTYDGPSVEDTWTDVRYDQTDEMDSMGYTNIGNSKDIV